MDKLRLRFWKHIHDLLEKSWHWVYYHKVVPLTPPRPTPESRYFLASSEIDEKSGNRVDIYRYK